MSVEAPNGWVRVAPLEDWAMVQVAPPTEVGRKVARSALPSPSKSPAVLRTSRVRAAPAAPTLPAASVARALRPWRPNGRAADGRIENEPSAPAVAEPSML